MSEEVVHFYNVITGKITCGVEPRGEPVPRFSVFEAGVTCADCKAGRLARTDPDEEDEEED